MTKQQEITLKKDTLTSAIYDIFDSIDLLKMLLELSESQYIRNYYNYLDRADSDLSNLSYRINNEIEFDDITIEETELTEDKLIQITKDIQELYINRE